MVADACELDSIDDSSFDLAHSNSVIEHVGLYPRVEKFARHFRRIAKRYYLQTPSFWFPIEPHFMCPLFHWLPEPVRASLLMSVSLGTYARSQTVSEAVNCVQEIHLLDYKMMRELFPDGAIMRERFALLTKSLIAMR
jgi:hypothetical protein